MINPAFKSQMSDDPRKYKFHSDSFIFWPLTEIKWYKTTRMKSETPMMLANTANCISVIIFTIGSSTGTVARKCSR